MAYIVLVTGGSRSGKSRYAAKTGEALDGPRAFVATCPLIDEEMNERIRKHREERKRFDWQTIEEPVELAAALRKTLGFNVRIVDCLTLWVNNLMYRAEQSLTRIDEDEISRKCEELLTISADLNGTIIFVTNEVGMGVIPDNPASRLFRDLVGRCNQTMAHGADEVTLLACGQPIDLKKGKSE